MELAIALPPEMIDEIVRRVALVVIERTATNDRPFLSVPEAAALLRAKPQRIYDLVSSGRLSRFHDGARLLVSRREILEHLTRGGQSGVAPSLPTMPKNRSRRGLRT